MTNPEKILDLIDVLIAYKKGQINYRQATTSFIDLTGLSSKVAREFLKGLKRENIVDLVSVKLTK